MSGDAGRQVLGRPWCDRCQTLGWFWQDADEQVPGRRQFKKLGRLVVVDVLRPRRVRFRRTCDCENGEAWQRKRQGLDT